MMSHTVGQVIKSVGPKLVPFFKAVAIYFVVFIPHDVPCVMGMLLKCAPILSLILFVVLHGMSFDEEYKYARTIVTGLIFCCIGDAFLIWPSCFEIGMTSFAIGHSFYISAFGFDPLNLPLGVLLFAINAAGTIYIMPGLYGVLVFGVPIYATILTVMVWRAIARVQFFEDLWTWSKLCSCAGGILFAISDFIIGVDKFKFNIEYSQALIMSTYYAAQLGIVLSVVDSRQPRKATKATQKATKATQDSEVLKKSISEPSKITQEGSASPRSKSCSHVVPSRIPVLVS